MVNIITTVCVCLLLGLCECQDGENEISESVRSESPTASYENQSLKQEVGSDVLPLDSTSERGCGTSSCELWKQLGALEERLNVTVRTLEEKLDATEKKLAALTSTVSQGQQQVAFSAARPVNNGNVAAGQTDLSLVYTDVLSNIGNAYSPITGFFIAPVNGVYYFSFASFFWSSGERTGGSLFQNGRRVVSWYGFSQTHDVSRSNSAVLQLRAGDAINVRVWAGYYIGDNGNRYCSFSGFLLFPM